MTNDIFCVGLTRTELQTLGVLLPITFRIIPVSLEALDHAAVVRVKMCIRDRCDSGVSEVFGQVNRRRSGSSYRNGSCCFFMRERRVYGQRDVYKRQNPMQFRVLKTPLLLRFPMP